MAIAFNIPSEREAPEENFSRLNRLLAELYEVLCHILVARPAGTDERQDREQDRERRGECPRDVTAASPYQLSCNSTYIVNLVMVVAIIKVSLSSSLYNAIR